MSPTTAARYCAAFAGDRRLADRNGVVAVRHLGLGMLGPGRDRAIVEAVERAVIDALRLEEEDRIGILDRGDQQALGVVRIGRHHRAQAADVRKHRLRALAMGLPAVDPAAARRADGDGRGKVAGRTEAQPRRLGNDLVVRRIDVVGELDLDARPQAICAHADGHADDAALGNRRIEHARLTVLLLQALGAAEHAAEIAHVLAEDHDVVILFHHHVHRRAQRLDHGHGLARASLVVRQLLRFGFGQHGQTPSCWRCSRKWAGISA